MKLPEHKYKKMKADIRSVAAAIGYTFTGDESRMVMWNFLHIAIADRSEKEPASVVLSHRKRYLEFTGEHNLDWYYGRGLPAKEQCNDVHLETAMLKVARELAQEQVKGVTPEASVAGCSEEKVWILKANIDYEGFHILGAWTDEGKAREQLARALEIKRGQSFCVYSTLELFPVPLNQAVGVLERPGVAPVLLHVESSEYEPQNAGKKPSAKGQSAKL